MIPGNAFSCDCADLSRAPVVPTVRRRNNHILWEWVCEPMTNMRGSAYDHWKADRDQRGRVVFTHVRTPESVEAVTEYRVRAAQYWALIDARGE